MDHPMAVHLGDDAGTGGTGGTGRLPMVQNGNLRSTH